MTAEEKRPDVGANPYVRVTHIHLHTRTRVLKGGGFSRRVSAPDVLISYRDLPESRLPRACVGSSSFPRAYVDAFGRIDLHFRHDIPHSRMDTLPLYRFFNNA